MHRRTVIGAGAAMAAGASPAFAASFDWDVPKLKTMQADGRWIAYYDVGVGRPLVLIHGMSGSAAMEWGA